MKGMVLMDRLEVYAKEKEQDKEQLKKDTIRLLELRQLDNQTIGFVIEQAFKLGHSAGHCRGEDYKNRLIREHGLA